MSLPGTHYPIRPEVRAGLLATLSATEWRTSRSIHARYGLGARASIRALLNRMVMEGTIARIDSTSKFGTPAYLYRLQPQGATPQ